MLFFQFEATSEDRKPLEELTSTFMPVIEGFLPQIMKEYQKFSKLVNTIL